MKLPREWMLLLGSLLIVGALYNHYLGHSAYLIEITFVAVGLVLAMYSVLVGGVTTSVPEDGLLIVFFSRYVPKKRLVTILPFVGFLIILAWSVWKLFVVGTADLQMEDFIVTLFGLSLVLYYSGPSRFATQKDFIVLYLMFMTIVFAVIWKLYTVITGNSYEKVTGYAEFYFITSPVVSVVDFFGVDATAHLDFGGYGLSNMITYEYHGRSLLLGIGTGCSGLYSAGLFFSAFLAFVLVRYRRFDRRILVALGLGLLVTWVSNIIRMTITIIVGSMYGHPALAFVHSYIGIIIFVICLTIFWTIIVRWLDRVENVELQKTAEASVATAGE
ncbi:MAG TPA: exosortase/archaeosortase family protein [Thermoplasmata archaeon]|nr:exosortase/archaeosortase family protein [Thermoplasmata archaeon]